MKFKFLLIFVISITMSYSQVVIGTTIPDASAVLELKSNNHGFLMPRLTAIQRDQINNPVEGLMVYCLDCCTNGNLTFYNGTKWLNINDCSDTDFDNDAIIDAIDVDDDNDDGILDKDEILKTKSPPTNLCSVSYEVSDDIYYYQNILSPNAPLKTPKGALTYLIMGENRVFELVDKATNTIAAKVRITLLRSVVSDI